MDELTERIVRLYVDEQLTMRQVGAIVGRNHTAVYQRLRKAGVRGRPRRLPRPQCANARCDRRVPRADMKYCSRRCWYQRTPPRDPRPCEQCGRIFVPAGTTNAGRFHSHPCYTAWTRGRPRRDRKTPDRVAAQRW